MIFVFNGDCVIRQLYETLEKLRYPEVAQTPYEDFETVILSGNKRIHLLHWLLQESQGFNNLSLNKFKDCSLNDKIFKCYFHVGLCSDNSILRGECDIEKQLQFFSLLTIFVKNIHLSQAESQKIDKQTTNNLLKAGINNVRADFNIKINITSLDNSAMNSSCEIESINILSQYLPKKYLPEKSLSEELFSSIKESMTKLHKLKTDSYEVMLQKLNTSFKKITLLQVYNLNPDTLSQGDYDLPTDLQNIHSTFCTVNKTLLNEAKIKNQPMPEKSASAVKPLTQAIKDNLVLIEQAYNMFNENQVES